MTTAAAFHQLNVGWLQLAASPAYATYPKHQAIYSILLVLETYSLVTFHVTPAVAELLAPGAQNLP